MVPELSDYRGNKANRRCIVSFAACLIDIGVGMSLRAFSYFVLSIDSLSFTSRLILKSVAKLRIGASWEYSKTCDFVTLLDQSSCFFCKAEWDEYSVEASVPSYSILKVLCFNFCKRSSIFKLLIKFYL